MREAFVQTTTRLLDQDPRTALVLADISSDLFRQAAEKHPDRVVTRAVRGMLPKTKLGRAMLKKLKVYAGPEHPHEAQQPEPWQPDPRRGRAS